MKTTKHTDITAEIDNICKHAGDWTYFTLEESLHRLLHTQREELVKSFRDEVIGEDEVYGPKFSVYLKNKLRAEQRQKLDRLK